MLNYKFIFMRYFSCVSVTWKNYTLTSIAREKDVLCGGHVRLFVRDVVPASISTL